MDDAFFAFYQSVELDVDMNHGGKMKGCTSLWLGCKEAVDSTTIKKLYLHSRRCEIIKVEVNGVECDFTHTDPLAPINTSTAVSSSNSVGGTNKNNNNNSSTTNNSSLCSLDRFYAEECDVSYRAALELTRQGELEITLPHASLLMPPVVGTATATTRAVHNHNQTSTQQSDSIISSLPQLPVSFSHKRKSSLSSGNNNNNVGNKMKIHQQIQLQTQREVMLRRDKLLKIISVLKKQTALDWSNRSNNDEGENEEGEQSPTTAAVNDNSSNSNTTHYPRLLVIKIEYSLPAHSKEGLVFRPIYGSNDNNTSSSGCCMYTLSKGTIGMRDPHGVRCWLPCIDTLSHRLILDVTVRTSSHYAVIGSGRLIDSYDESEDKGSQSRRVTRYFTVTRIPPSAYGLYIGWTEQYSIPMYKALGRVYVARGIVDRVYIPQDYTNDQNKEEKSCGVSATAATDGAILSIHNTISVSFKQQQQNEETSVGMQQEQQPPTKRHKADDNTTAGGDNIINDEEDNEEECSIMAMLRNPIGDSAVLTTTTPTANDDVNTPTETTTPTAVIENDEAMLLALIEEEEDELSAVATATTATTTPRTSMKNRTIPHVSATTAAMSTNVNKASVSAVSKKSDKYSFVVPTSSSTAKATTTAPPSSSVSLTATASPALLSTGACTSRLYRDRVRHTTLGLDLALRLLHKHTQHKFDHPQYTQIFIPHLEEDFLAFDGMTFMDMRYLIGPDLVAQETSSHLMQLRAYLHCWLALGTAALPIDSSDCEFILHGLVSSLLQDYCESVFGEDSAMYLHQQALDTCLTLEKLGHSYALSDTCLPETYERFSPYFRQYMNSKASVLFHMINTKLGGRDISRTVYTALIKSPLLKPPSTTKSSSSSTANAVKQHHHHFAGTSSSPHGYGTASGSMSPSEHFTASLSYLGLSFHHPLAAMMSNPHQQQLSGDISPSHYSSEPQTPYSVYSDYPTPGYSGIGSLSPPRSDSLSLQQSPYPMGSMMSSSPYPYSTYSPSYPTQYSPSPNPYLYMPYSPSYPTAIIAGTPHRQSQHQQQQLLLSSSHTPNPYLSMPYSPGYPYAGDMMNNMMSSPRARTQSFDSTGGGGVGNNNIVSSSAVINSANNTATNSTNAVQMRQRSSSEDGNSGSSAAATATVAASNNRRRSGSEDGYNNVNNKAASETTKITDSTTLSTAGTIQPQQQQEHKEEEEGPYMRLARSNSIGSNPPTASMSAIITGFDNSSSSSSFPVPVAPPRSMMSSSSGASSNNAGGVLSSIRHQPSLHHPQLSVDTTMTLSAPSPTNATTAVRAGGYSGAYSPPHYTRTQSQSSSSSSTAAETLDLLLSGGEAVTGGSAVAVVGLTLDNFISYVQSVAGTDCELDEDFIDNFVINCGIHLIRFGVFVAPKIENRPQFMTLANETVFIRHGKIITARQAAVEKGGQLQRLDVKTRIVEARDEIITEPMMRLSIGSEETHQQQVYTRPGRKGGKRRGVGLLSAEEEAALTPLQRAERLCVESERDCIEQARDLDEPVRYALLDPQGVSLVGEMNILSTDASLIEQLYAETDASDVLRQIQALRSLARALPLHNLTAAAVTTGGGGGASSTSQASQLQTLARRQSPDSLRLTALSDCLFGVPISGNYKHVVADGHCLHVRIEAAFALALWQNERAPIRLSTSGSSSGTESSSQNSGGSSNSSSATNDKSATVTATSSSNEWKGLSVLFEATHQLYTDAATLLPTACDWVCESHTQLRCSLLMAISTIHAQNGLSPLQVINTLLLFAEWHVNTPVVSSTNTSASSSSSSTDTQSQSQVKFDRKLASLAKSALSKSSSVIYDDSHYIATVLLALCNVRVEDCNKKDSNDTLKRVCDFALTKLSADVALARLKAHMEREAQAEERARDWARVRVRVSGGDKNGNNSSDDHTEGEDDEDSNGYSNSYQQRPVQAEDSDDDEEQQQEQQDYIYPQLTLAGAVCAAAITCLSLVDIQATVIGERKKMSDTAVCIVGCYSFGTTMGPTGVGCFSLVKYTDFFIRPYASSSSPAAVSSAYSSHSSSGSRSGGGVQQQLLYTKEAGTTERIGNAYVFVPGAHYDMYTWAVRLAALEAFVKICLTQMLLFHEQQIRQLHIQQRHAQNQSSQTSKDNKATPPQLVSLLVPAVVEAVLHVITHDPDRRTRRGAALCLLECLQDRPSGCTATAALSHGDGWTSSTLGVHDTDALTRNDWHTVLTTHSVHHHTTSTGTGGGKHGHHKTRSAQIKDIWNHAEGMQVRIMYREWWRRICGLADDEVVRCLLFRTWLYVFGTSSPPACLVKKTSAASESSVSVSSDSSTTAESMQSNAVLAIKKQLYDSNISTTTTSGNSIDTLASSTSASVLLTADRLIVRDPTECQYKCEMILRHGRSYKPPPSVATTTTTGSETKLALQQPRQQQQAKSQGVNNKPQLLPSSSSSTSSSIPSTVATSARGTASGSTGLKLSLSFKPSAANKQV